VRTIASFMLGGQAGQFGEGGPTRAPMAATNSPRTDGPLVRVVVSHGHDTRADAMNEQNSSRLTVHTLSTNATVPVWSP
jgi:hypothetical protein